MYLYNTFNSDITSSSLGTLFMPHSFFSCKSFTNEHEAPDSYIQKSLKTNFIKKFTYRSRARVNIQNKCQICIHDFGLFFVLLKFKSARKEENLSDVFYRF